MLQCHLAVPVRAGQELPRRRQAAHPRRGGATLLGISTAARAASAVSKLLHSCVWGGRRPPQCLCCSICTRFGLMGCPLPTSLFG